jgi:hypothetical protein
MKTKFPTYDQLMNPLLQALTALGGSGSVEESGFIHVEVTECSGDGGIDGKGIARVTVLSAFTSCFNVGGTRGRVHQARSATSEAPWWDVSTWGSSSFNRIIL